MPAQRAIATPHHLATAAGELMYTEGGNAVDAALAAAAVLTVVYPHNTSIGGDLTALVAQGSAEPELIDAFGYAPAGVDSKAWGTSGRVPSRGPESITVPGAVKGWKHLHDNYGSLPLPTILAPAVEHARGYEIGRSVRTLIDEVSQESAAGRELMEAMFGPEFADATHAANPALGATLARLAEAGLDDFYHGQTASRVHSYLTTVRPDFTPEDFSEYEVRSTPSLSMDFAGLTVHTGGAPSQGFGLLRLLDDLATSLGTSTDVSAMTDAALAEVWIESFTQSDAIRDSVLAEGVTGSELLAAVRDDLEPVPAPAAGGDTIGIAASDGELAVSLIQSLYSSFGSLCFDPETGVLFQCRGSMFSLDAASPQFVRPRTRPPHTLMPVLITDGTGGTVIVQATMGGKAQAQIHSRLFIHLLRGATPAEATAWPRWVSGAKAASAPVRTITVEDDVDAEVKSILATGAEGELRTVPRHSDSLGHANVIDLRGDSVQAASDPRSDGSSWVG
ncbi:gamma-glutamyltransferase [Brevibacterium renqingii]|uniref:gamma-glutamyltransferase n=1 Tax=Brevibacterium renqingii TaxID=2776916 RepID=UPI001AE08ECA|nr:gamma-glutamyltransferase [Brevibacterium renqingii]